MFLLIFVALVSLVSLLVFVISLILLVIDFFKKKSIIKYAIILPSVFILFIASGFTSAYISNHIDKDETRKSNQSGYKVYDLNVSNITTTDLSDWKITGTTSAPDGAKLFATYGDETDDDYYGINAASSSDIESWATVRNGKFTMMVNPLSLRYEEKYKGGTNFKAYLFAVTGLKGKLSKYSDDPKISDNLKSSIAKKIKTTSLTLTDSQADYYNNLGSDSSDSSKDGDSESSSSSASSSSSSSSSTQSSSTSVPREYKSALNSADTYANEMHMSKAGLYEQLTADAGEKFSPEAAQYAVDNVKTDWNKNALESAKSYQEMDMSPESIRDQLTSDSGEQFTQEQADYAIANLPQ